MNEPTGNMPFDETGFPVGDGIPRETSGRRRNLRSNLYPGERGGSACYQNLDVPVIAYRYRTLWKGVKMSRSNRAVIY